MAENTVGTMVRKVTLGLSDDRRTYEIWCMHWKGDVLVSGTELKARATASDIRGTRADREHFSAHSAQLPLELAGSFPSFTDDLARTDGIDALIGYMHTDGFGVWCYDQAELKGLCDRRTLFVRRVPNEPPPPCS